MLDIETAERYPDLARIAVKAGMAVDVREGDQVCPQCERTFTPRAGNGGKPQRFCSAECRRAFHANNPAPKTPTPPNDPTPAPTLLMDLPTSEPSPPADDDDGPTPFDWEKDEDAVVLRSQAATAVYNNGSGDLVIRQEQRSDESEENVVIIRKEHAQAFLDAICDALGVPSAAP